MTARNRNVTKWKAIYARATKDGHAPKRATEIADNALARKTTGESPKSSLGTRDWSREEIAARRALARSAAEIERRHRRTKTQAFAFGELC